MEAPRVEIKTSMGTFQVEVSATAAAGTPGAPPWDGERCREGAEVAAARAGGSRRPRCRRLPARRRASHPPWLPCSPA